jgi:hypothetical protein
VADFLARARRLQEGVSPVPAASPPSQRLLQSWVPENLATELRERAAAADRSISAELRQAIRLYLAEGTDKGHGANT